MLSPLARRWRRVEHSKPRAINPVPASNRPSLLASWLSVADEGGVAPLAREDPHGFRNRP